MNQKLKDNILSSVLSGLTEIQGISSDARRHMSQMVSSAIESSVANTWEEMTLAERCGPPLWDFLLWTAAVADDEDKPHLYTRALSLIQEGHPCKDICRPHMRSNLQQVNPKDYPTCTDHCIALHNLVNRQLGKDEYPPVKAKEKVDLGCDSCTFNPVGKSRSSQSHVDKKTGNITGRNETFPTNAGKNYYNNSKPLSVRTKTYSANSGYKTNSTHHRNSVIDAIIQYPSSYRTRDTNTTGVYTSRGSPSYRQ